MCNMKHVMLSLLYMIGFWEYLVLLLLLPSLILFHLNQHTGVSLAQNQVLPIKNNQ